MPFVLELARLMGHMYKISKQVTMCVHIWTHAGGTLDMDIKGSACWSPSPYKYN